MINKINELCYAYQDYGAARERKDWDAVKRHTDNMARIRADLKRLMKKESEPGTPAPAAGAAEGQQR